MVLFSILSITGLTWFWLFLCVYCQNGRRNLTSSMNEASRDLIVHTHSKKKQALLVGFSIYFRHLGSTDCFFNLLSWNISCVIVSFWNHHQCALELCVQNYSVLSSIRKWPSIFFVLISKVTNRMFLASSFLDTI